MSTTLIDRNEDLTRLRREGYTVEVRRGTGTHLLVHDVPYVNSRREVARGTLVAPLELNGELTTSPIKNHQTWFIGEHPCDAEGGKLADVEHGSADQSLGDGITVNHDFSVKPRNGIAYKDNHEKFVRYIKLIGAPADKVQPGVRATVFKAIVDESGDSVFRYSNTATSKVGIASATEKLALARVAIVGLGGTGSYVLDAIAKTPIRQIDLYDGDIFIQHNAFRSPGAPALEELTAPKKVDYFAGIYSKMHKGVAPHGYYVDDRNVAELKGCDFVFVCVDRGGVRKLITDALLSYGVPFVDAGIGVHRAPTDQLGGQVRTTLATPAKHEHLSDRATMADRPPEDDLYKSNIQIAELNALNAVMAVIRWKKLFGFYVDDACEFHSVYRIATGSTVRGDFYAS
jgi:molybdopterin/thiamine biosynthesis adenylyltransferase